MNIGDPKRVAEKEPQSGSDGLVLLIVAGYALAFVVFGFLVDSPEAVWRGIGAILTSRDTLLTDYMGVGGIGAALVSAGTLTLSACLVYFVARAKMTGAAVAALFLVLGFGLFGKNLLNIWFIVLGVALYSRFRGQRFADNINTAFFGVALSPIVSEILFSTALPLEVRVPLAAGTGLLMGFVLPPAAAQLFKAHMGYALYNMGFTAGLLGTLVVALYKSYGFVPDPVFIWTSGNNLLLGAFLGVIFASMLILGFVLDRHAFRRFRDLLRETGQSPSDFIAISGLGGTLVNMGLSGALGMGYVLAVGGDLNGPSIGALLSIVGFAAFGKHIRNLLPVMAGVFIGSLAKPFSAADPSLLLAALFGTNLAPIAGSFGWHWGVVAGFIHSSAALSVGVVHGGMNLYNNGFAAGIVAAITVPVILAIRSRREDRGAGATSASAEAAGGRSAPVSPRRHRVGGILVRAAFFLGFWLLLSAPDVGVLLQEPNSVGGAGGVVLASEIAVAILASATATSVSLWLWPVGSGRPRLGVLLVLIGRFLVQMVRSGVDVARRAFDPRLPIQPGFVTFRSRLESPQQRAVLGALSSAQPGSIAAGVTPGGDLIYHCLDVRDALEPQLRRDESLLARLCRKEGL